MLFSGRIKKFKMNILLEIDQRQNIELDKVRISIQHIHISGIPFLDIQQEHTSQCQQKLV